ncbi:UNVERIFIED_CONTAM: Ubiquinol oxidase 2, mitochondrial [Sesamum latifolium]|uniref:Ubiquinol oxidase n=1 Tax=Sesamum latifolium TaxID=2727402 RepID=A0AAW2SMP0_9LAMI
MARNGGGTALGSEETSCASHILDKVAYWTVKALRFPTDIFFQRRYGCRAMMLETVAAVPGMVGGMLLHCKSLRRFEHSGGWIKALLEEAENERMHLMTFMEVSQPRWYERALVFTVQGVFFNAYFLTYLISPKLAHRIVGYLEEEAIHSYTEFLKELDKGTIENVRLRLSLLIIGACRRTQHFAMSSWLSEPTRLTTVMSTTLHRFRLFQKLMELVTVKGSCGNNKVKEKQQQTARFLWSRRRPEG